MPTLTFSYDTGNVPLSRIINSYAEQFGYVDTINGQPNPETKAEFARRMVRTQIVSVVRASEVGTAIKTAKDAVTPIDIT
jgi:hypothetical protein